MCHTETQLRSFGIPCPALHVMRYRTPCKARFRSVVSLFRIGVELTGFHRKVECVVWEGRVDRLKSLKSIRAWIQETGSTDLREVGTATRLVVFFRSCIT